MGSRRRIEEVWQANRIKKGGIKERTYSLGEEIRNRVETNKIPKGYGHEVQYLETAKEAYGLSKEASEFLEELKPFEGKKVLLREGKPVTLRKILKESWEEFKNRKK